MRLRDTISARNRQNISIIFSTHQPIDAQQCAAHTLAVDKQGQVQFGETNTLLTADFLTELYDVRTEDLVRVVEKL